MINFIIFYLNHSVNEYYLFIITMHILTIAKALKNTKIITNKTNDLKRLPFY